MNIETVRWMTFYTMIPCTLQGHCLYFGPCSWCHCGRWGKSCSLLVSCFRYRSGYICEFRLPRSRYWSTSGLVCARKLKNSLKSYSIVVFSFGFIKIKMIVLLLFRVLWVMSSTVLKNFLIRATCNRMPIVLCGVGSITDPEYIKHKISTRKQNDSFSHGWWN